MSKNSNRYMRRPWVCWRHLLWWWPDRRWSLPPGSGRYLPPSRSTSDCRKLRCETKFSLVETGVYKVPHNLIFTQPHFFKLDFVPQTYFAAQRAVAPWNGIQEKGYLLPRVLPSGKKLLKKSYLYRSFFRPLIKCSNLQ